VQFWQRVPEWRQRTGLLYLSYQSGAHRQAALSPPSAPFSPHNHLHTQNTPATSNMFNNRAPIQPALIASFIPIYFCHSVDLRDRTVESEGTPSGPRLLVSIPSPQSFLLSSITAGNFNQMTCDRGIKYPCDWQPLCLQLWMQRGRRHREDPDRWLMLCPSINQQTHRRIGAGEAVSRQSIGTGPTGRVGPRQTGKH